MAENEKKNPMGRPTKYKESFVDLTPYLDHCRENKELPSITGYAVYLKVAERTVSNWGEKHPDFLRSLGVLLTISKQTLMNKGLTGDYNSNMAKMILSANHGMREGLDYTSGGKPIAPQIVVFGTPMKDNDDPEQTIH